MRRLRLSIIIVLSIIWFVLLLPYFLMQTSFGANLIGQQLSKLSPYTISIGKVSHSFSNFYELSFDDVVISNEKQQLVNVPKLVVGFDKDNLWQLNHFNYITVFEGVIDYSQKAKDYNFTANTLKLVDTKINIPLNNNQDKLSLNQLNGGIKSFNSQGEGDYQFDLTAQQVMLNQQTMDKVLIQGFHRNNIITVTKLGGNVDNGFFVSKLKIMADNSWDIEQLKINKIHFKSMDDHYSTILPKLVIRQLTMFDSSIQLPELTIDKGNIDATNLRYDQQWIVDDSDVTLSAESVVWHDEVFSSALLQLQFKNNQVEIQKAMANWNEGNLDFTGSWSDNALHLEKLLLAGVNYQVPPKSDGFLLPDLFSRVEVDQLTILPGMLIDKNSDFPFVFINFEMSGSNVVLVQDRKLGIYAGTLFCKAERGSINEIDIKYPDLVVKFDAQDQTLVSFSSLVSGGMVEAIATIDPTQTEFVSLHLTAYNISSSLLKEWKLIEEPPKSINYSADLHGSISPFKLSGTLLSNENEFIINP